jgi:hypothetical protein
MEGVTPTPWPSPRSTILIDRPGVRAQNPVGASISAHAKRQIDFTPITGRKRKRQKIKDQLKGSFDSPPAICQRIEGIDTVSCVSESSDGYTRTTNGLSGLMMMDRGLTYYCPSKSIPGMTHRVELKIANGVTTFSCSCDHVRGEFDSSQNACSHIRATVIKIMLDLISKQQTSVDINAVTDMFNAMMV